MIEFVVEDDLIDTLQNASHDNNLELREALELPRKAWSPRHAN